jgi:hypothetical protein
LRGQETRQDSETDEVKNSQSDIKGAKVEGGGREIEGRQLQNFDQEVDIQREYKQTDRFLDFIQDRRDRG